MQGQSGVRGFRFAGIVANVSWTSFEQLLRLGLSFLVMIQVINYLGPERFGLYSYVISLIGMLIPLTAFGLEQVVIARLVERPDESGTLLGTSFIIRVMAGVASFALALIVESLLDSGDAMRMRLTTVAATMLLLQAGDTIGFYFKSVMGAKYISLARIAGLVSTTGTTIFLLLSGAGIAAFLWMRALEALVTGVALIIAYGRKASHIGRWRFDWAECLSMLKAGFPLFIASLAVMIYMRVAQLMLGQMAAPAELGYYGVAVRLAEVLNFIPVAIVTAYYPSMVEDSRHAPARYRRKAQGVLNLMALIGYASAAGALFGGQYAFHLLFGTRYDPALPMFVILVCAMPFLCFGVVLSALLTIERRFWTATTATIFGVVVNISLNFWLIPRYLGEGAAWAALCSYWMAGQGVCLILPSLRPAFLQMIKAMVWPDPRLLRDGPADGA